MSSSSNNVKYSRSLKTKVQHKTLEEDLEHFFLEVKFFFKVISACRDLL